MRAPDWSEGLSASLRRGLGALPAASRGVVVFLADMPLVPPGGAARLIEALASGAPGAELRHNGGPAHPVAYGRALFGGLGALRGDAGGRRLFAGRADVIRLEAGDPGATYDIDRVEDLGAQATGGGAAGPGSG